LFNTTRVSEMALAPRGRSRSDTMRVISELNAELKNVATLQIHRATLRRLMRPSECVLPPFTVTTPPSEGIIPLSEKCCRPPKTCRPLQNVAVLRIHRAALRKCNAVIRMCPAALYSHDAALQRQDAALWKNVAAMDSATRGDGGDMSPSIFFNF